MKPSWLHLIEVAVVVIPPIAYAVSIWRTKRFGVKR